MQAVVQVLLAQRENVRSDLNRNVRFTGEVVTRRGDRGDDQDEGIRSGQAGRVGAGFAWRDEPITGLEAVVRLSRRQLRGVERRYAAQGAAGLVDRLRGRGSNRKLDTSVVV